MPIAETIATVTATPTTKSGRSASSPGVGSLRTALITIVSIVTTAGTGYMLGQELQFDRTALMGAIITLISAGLDFIRRTAAERVVEETHA